uniref:Putative F-box domain-containing protein n=1 Tax=Tanacetum cinerariifolium TaxID=118510 RepID=A0A699HUU3_TANCI|nr:putative F-box domain-containing protein [Tanacetum cinerariifolium]
MQRLPAKSLIRFKSVSKPWNSLIHNSMFISDCYVIQRTQAHNPLLIRYSDTEDDDKDKCVSIIDDDTFPKHKFSLSIPVSVKNPRGSLLGSSQGLFCFYKLYNSQFVRWNPTIKKSVAIDLPTNDDELDIVPDHRTTIGFGVCPNTLDAKLVKITSENPFVSITNVIQVEVYTLSLQVWRILVSNLPQKSLLFLDWVDVGGFIYWFAQDSVSHSYLITSFDLTSEVFTEVSLPDCLTSNDDNYVFLSKLGDSLVLVEGNNWDIHKTFRMARPLFNEIVTSVIDHNPFFRNYIDCTKKEVISGFLKCTSSIRQLAYGVHAEFLDEYMQISERSSHLALDHFCLLCKFMGLSIRGNLRAIIRRDHGPNPFILLEVVASQDLWIWHAFFGVAGSNKDINVLYQSPLFNDLKTGRAPEISFVANDVTYPSGYYLVHGIYPKLAPLVKTIPEPADDDHKRILYKQKHESVRKDVKRAFGALKKK